jgi:glycosyltransferase involved in cell wall biosynthesis
MERLLNANGAVVEPVALCSPGRFAERLRQAGIAVHEEPGLAFLDRGRVRYSPLRLATLLAWRLMRVTRAIRQLLRTRRFDVVHANGIVSAFYTLPSVVLGRVLAPRTRWIWSNYDLRFPDGELTATLARWCTRLFHRTIAASRAVKERFGAALDGTVVLHGGLDLEQVRFLPAERAAFREEIGAAPSTIVVGIVGSIEEGKGHHLLLDAVARLQAQGADVLLAIVGRFGASEPEYERRIRSMVAGMGGGARLCGFREDVLRVYAGIDVLVNATTSRREEPLGTTIYEAMACERVVVATRTGGSDEIVRDGVDGFLCAPDDADALYVTLRRVLDAWESMDTVRRAARRTVAERFSVARVCADYNALLAAVLATR